MNRHAGMCAVASLFVAAGRASTAVAGALDNVTYTSAELQQQIACFNASNFIVGPAGSNNALALREVFIVLSGGSTSKNRTASLRTSGLRCA